MMLGFGNTKMDMLGKTMAVGVLKSYPVAIGSPTFDMEFNVDILGSGERWMRKEQQALDQLPFTRAQVKGFREIFVENVPLAGLLNYQSLLL